MDSGYDETHNPFADVSEEYTKKKEENMAKKAVKRMSAQQRQINKVYAKSNKCQIISIEHFFSWSLFYYYYYCYYYYHLLLLVLLLMLYSNSTEGSHGQRTSLSSYEVPDVYMYIQLDVLTIMG